MKETKKKAVILSLIGGASGLIICFVISVMSGSDGEGVSAGTRVFYYVISFLHGALCMGTTVVYDIEDWSIARATVTHFLITLTSFNLLGFLQGWLKFGSAAFWIMMACFAAVYFLIWLIIYIRYRKAIKEVNRDLEQIKTAGTRKPG